MVLAAWLDAARGLHVPAVFLFAAALKLSIFVCRNPISPAPFSAKFSTLAMLKVFHRTLCQDLTTVKSAALFLCVSTGSTGSAQHWHSCSLLCFWASVLQGISSEKVAVLCEEDALAGIFLPKCVAPLSQIIFCSGAFAAKAVVVFGYEIIQQPSTGLSSHSLGQEPSAFLPTLVIQTH